MGCCPSQNTQNQCQGDAVAPGEGGTGPPCSTQCTSSQNGLLPLPVPWGHTGLHCQPLVYLKGKNDLNVITNIKAGAITPNQINSPTSCMSSSPTSMILEKRKSCCLKIRLDLPHKMAKWIARSAKMNNSSRHNCGRKPCRFGTV